MEWTEWLIIGSFFVCWPIAYFLFKKWDRELHDQVEKWKKDHE